jgi:phosphoglycolate phosphatase
MHNDLKQYELLIFDWDGTLMDSTGSITRSIQRAAADIGLAVPSDEVAAHVIGLSLQDALHYALPSLDPEDYPALVERYRHHYLAQDADIVLFDGIAEMLEKLRKRGHLLAVATGKNRPGLDRVLNSTSLTRMFDATRTADETRSKPHPQMVLELTDYLGVDPKRSLMVGDTTHDLQMAQSAGVAALGVSYGAHPHENLAALKPLAVLRSSKDLDIWLTTHA